MEDLCWGWAAEVRPAFFSAAERLGGWPEWLVWASLAATLVAGTWYTAIYFRRIDELDLLDNLWSSLIGFYVFVAALPVWKALHEVSDVPEPHALGLWYISIAAAVLAYGWRKLRGRF